MPTPIKGKKTFEDGDVYEGEDGKAKKREKSQARSAAYELQNRIFP